MLFVMSINISIVYVMVLTWHGKSKKMMRIRVLDILNYLSTTNIITGI